MCAIFLHMIAKPQAGRLVSSSLSISNPRLFVYQNLGLLVISIDYLENFETHF